MPTKERIIIYAVLMLGLLILSLRFFFPLFILLAVIGFLGFAWFIYNYSQNQQLQQQLKNSPVGRINAKLEVIQAQRKLTESELHQVDENIRRLKSSMENARSASDNTAKEAKSLLSEFEQQRELRLEKLKFYRLGRQKLEDLLTNYKFSKELQESRKHLRRLSAEREEDIAELEELRWDIQQDHLYLDSLEELESRLEQSASPQLAKDIQLELEQIIQDFESQQRR